MLSLSLPLSRTLTVQRRRTSVADEGTPSSPRKPRVIAATAAALIPREDNKADKRELLHSAFRDTRTRICAHTQAH